MSEQIPGLYSSVKEEGKPITKPAKPISILDKLKQRLHIPKLTGAAKPAYTEPVKTPERGVTKPVPRPIEQAKITKIPRVLKQGMYARNTGIKDSDGNSYINTEDAELLNKLGFSVNPNEYSFLAIGDKVEDTYSYIEKTAGLSKDVVKAIDNDEPFSAEYLKDLDYTVPDGYEVKGDLVVPIEKKAAVNEENFQDIPGFGRVNMNPDPGVKIVSITPVEPGGHLYHSSSQKLTQLDPSFATARGYGYEYTKPVVFANPAPDELFASSPTGAHKKLVDESLGSGKGYPRVYHMLEHRAKHPETQEEILRKIYLGAEPKGYHHVVDSDGWFAAHRKLLKGQGEHQKWVDVMEYIKPDKAEVIHSISANNPTTWEMLPDVYEYVPELAGKKVPAEQFLKLVKDENVRRAIEEHLSKPFIPGTHPEVSKFLKESLESGKALPELVDDLTRLISKSSGKIGKLPIPKTTLLNKLLQSMSKRASDLVVPLEKKAAADPSQTILITGHSGAGKSTLGKLLAEKLNLPLHRVDAHPEFKEYVTKDNEHWKDSLTPGTQEYKHYTDLVNRANRDTLKASDSASIIEGAQLGHLSPEELAKYKAHILVGGDVEQSTAQRIQRAIDKAAKKGITFSPEEIELKKAKSKLVADYWEPGMEKFKQLPGVLRYNHTEDKPELLIDRLREILEKKAAADHPLKSTNIKAVGYDKKEKTMEVEFHSGGTYKYNDVPKSLFDRIKRVKSPGKFFHKHIRRKDKFPFSKLEKESAEKIAPPLPHQRKAVEKLLNQDQEGLILMHGLGSGKTRTSIEAYKALGLPAEVIVPAALKGNYAKEIKKWVGKSPKDISIKSQQEIARKGLENDLSNKLMVIDEAHRIRNPGSKLLESIRQASPAKRLLLTGTPIYNHPSDLSAIINTASGKDLLPEERKAFEEEYIEYKNMPQSFIHRLMMLKPEQKAALKNAPKLKKILNKYIDYYPGSSEGFPEVKDELVHVPMSENQLGIYKALMKEIPWILRKKIELGLAPGKQELDKLMPFLTGARMISNTTAGFEKNPDFIKSPKLEEAVNYLKNKIKKDPEYKALVYSNYLESGVNPYKKYLDKENIPYGEFTGEIKDSVRNQLIQDYNNNKLKALLVSSAGAEGLDLKGTRLVQILEPHFNNEKIKQVIGRAARYKSHEALSPDKRNVLVQKYLSSVPKSFWQKLFGNKSTSTDEYLQNMADEKEQLNKQFVKLIQNI